MVGTSPIDSRRSNATLEVVGRARKAMWIAAISLSGLILVLVLYILGRRDLEHQSEQISQLRGKAAQRDAICADVQAQLTFAVMDIKERGQGSEADARARTAIARISPASKGVGSMFQHCSAPFPTEEWNRCEASNDDTCLVRILSETIDHVRRSRWSGDTP